MHVLFVCPRFPDSLSSFRGICRLAGVDSAQSPIGLATLAGLTPPEISVSLLDENVEPIDSDHACDVVAVFQDTFAFLQEDGTPFTTAGVSFAIEQTRLHARLEREARLFPSDPTTVQVQGSADLNFVPKQMSIDEVECGYNWMIRALCRYDHHGERLVRAMRAFVPWSATARWSARRLSGLREPVTAVHALPA